MEESILSTIKKLLGITDEYGYFDQDILIHVNSVMMVLSQLGIKASDNFDSLNEYTTWSDYLGDDLEDPSIFGSIRSYVYLKVKLLFDPPQNSFTIESINKLINELEWRLNVSAEEVNLPEQLVNDKEVK